MAFKIIYRYTVYICVHQRLPLVYITLLLNENFLTSNLDLFLNNFFEYPLSTDYADLLIEEVQELLSRRAVLW